MKKTCGLRGRFTWMMFNVLLAYSLSPNSNASTLSPQEMVSSEQKTTNPPISAATKEVKPVKGKHKLSLPNRNWYHHTPIPKKMGASARRRGIATSILARFRMPMLFERALPVTLETAIKVSRKEGLRPTTDIGPVTKGRYGVYIRLKARHKEFGGKEREVVFLIRRLIGSDALFSHTVLFYGSWDPKHDEECFRAFLHIAYTPFK